MKRIVTCFALAVLWGCAGRANAEIGTLDEVPAATLLIPHFEVDLDDVNGVDTLFTINNASATAILVHVTLWTDWAVPSFAFDLYLTGYDSQGLDLRDVFEKGVIPVTASAGQDPTDTISHKGPYSQDINFSSCLESLPPPALAAARDHIRAAHTGKRSPFNGQCSGQDHGDNIARGYVTADTVNSCSGANVNPSTSAYIQDVITWQNVIWGNYVIVERNHQTAYGNPAVHIEAASPGSGVFTSGDSTFYGRYEGNSAYDGREPLPTNWAARYYKAGDVSAGTDVIIWRDTTVPPTGPNLGACGSEPVWYPLSYEYIEAFDEQENFLGLIPASSRGSTVPDRNMVAPAATNRTSVLSAAFHVPFDFGWIYLNMNLPSGGADPPTVSQTFVTVLHRFSTGGVGIDALPLDTAKNPILDPLPTQEARRRASNP